MAARQAAEALVVDARPPAAFGGGRLPGALFAGLGPNFAAWMGWLAPYDRDLILVLDGNDAFPEARTELRRIGLDRTVGYLGSGLAAWTAAGLPTEALPRLAVTQWAARRSGASARLTVLDVRTDDEWHGGRIPGAVHSPAAEIVHGATPPTAGAAEVAVVCASGYRSMVAASVLQSCGLRGPRNVDVGMFTWLAVGLPMDR